MNLFRKVFQPKEVSSREIAKERLQLVLVHDRAQISPGLLQVIKDEIIDVISRYVEIEREGVEISFTQNRRESRLQADIPLVSGRRRQRATQ